MDPVPGGVGAYLFGAISRLTLDIQGAADDLRRPEPVPTSPTFFLDMLPYALVILVVVLGSREAIRKRIGAPAALGVPYVRGERGR